MHVKERLFGSPREGVAGGWRKLRNENINKFSASFSIYYYVDQIKEDMRTVLIARRRVESGRSHLIDFGVGGRMTLKSRRKKSVD
jgi:hypothetical protein